MRKFKRILSLTLSSTLIITSILYFHDVSLTTKASSVNAVTINPSLQYQTIKGWGTSLAWWGDLVGKWSTSAKDKLMDLTFDKDKGLGLNIVRYNIGGGENPNHNHMRPGGEIEGYEPSEGVWDWNADAGQRWVLQQAKQRIPSSNFIAEAFSNSPPYWMTNSGCASGEKNGGNNLKDDKYDAFANYFTEVIKHFKESWGITFNTANPLNEPIGGWWKSNGTQEGCNFDRIKESELINKVYNSLQSKSLTETKISASDESSIDWSVETLNSFNDETKSCIGQINTHEYSGSNRAELRDLAATLNKPLYMDEICTGSGTHGHDNMDSGLALADYIFKDMRDMKVPAWEIWQVVDDEDKDVAGNSNWGLIHAHWSGDNVEKYYLTKQYYAMAHFSKFIKPGYKIIDSNNSNVVAAYDSESKNLVLVSRNTLSSDSNFSFDLSKFDLNSSSIKAYRTTSTDSLENVSNFNLSNNYLNDTLPSKSMITYVISNVNYSDAIGTTSNDNVKGNGNNQFDYGNSTTWTYYSGQAGAYSNDIHYTNTKDDYYKVNFTGNQIKIYGAKANDSGIAAISIDDKPETLVDMYSANRQDNSLLYTSPVLTSGNHTIKVRATGTKNSNSSNCFLTADRVVSYEGAKGDEISIPPSLTSLNPGDGRLTVVFSPVDGASSYNIKYGDSSGNYTNIINNVTDTIYNITGLENSKKYYVTVSAVTDKGETASSNELSETPIPPDNPNLLYYINAGDNNPLSLENGEKLGTRNSSEDQSYGRDPVTGYHWGYIADDNKTWSQDNEASIGSNYGCLRQYDGYGKGKGLEYKFEVPNGRYFITMGFYDPWNSSNRKEDIIINGATRDSNFIPGNKKTSKSYEANVTDGILSIKAVGSDDNCDHPMISWINVENYIPVSDITLNTNTLNIQTGNSETLSASISPENAQNKMIVWTSSDENIVTVNQNGLVTGIKFGTATITATSVDGNKTAQCNVTVLPQLKNITLNADRTILKKDSTSKLNIQGTMTDESKADLSQALIEYSSDNQKVATINDKGIVTALSEGSAKIKVSVTLNGVNKESFIELTVDNTPPTFNLSINGNTLEDNGTFEDYIPLTFKSWDELSGLQSAKIKIDNKDYVIDSNANSPISINLAGKLGKHKATITAVDVAGNKLKKTVSFNVVTSIDSISNLLDHYIKSKEVTGPIVLQLTGDLAQAKHQLDKGSPDKASKYMSYFIIHLNINPFSQNIPRDIKNILTKDAEYMIFFPR
ncbi:Ig-like domain-containing protein [Clostridium sp. SHJSY1]|uniref:glycoside hydrolase n=1 Tax=Clostridium sp. SHJSY1 TaxID=2942483 RepID=UPI0028742649|nr:glycoside hydrolase [Clostridium sp. SHJSY1]MDS0524253.1 Ig-like domain-containing protein [Clostridium sp. SHJSY1]